MSKQARKQTTRSLDLKGGNGGHDSGWVPGNLRAGGGKEMVDKAGFKI